jgi:hypothetical protein
MLRKWQALSAEGLHGEQQDVATEDLAQQAARHRSLSPDNQDVMRYLVFKSRSDGMNSRTARASCPPSCPNYSKRIHQSPGGAPYNTAVEIAMVRPADVLERATTKAGILKE